MAAAIRTPVQPKDINSVLYAPWRAFIKGGPALTDRMSSYEEILKDRVTRLRAWAQSRPNSTQLKTLLGRVQGLTISEERIKRALGLLEISQTLEKKSEENDLLLDQAQDDLNIAFDEIYLLHPKGLENIGRYFNNFAQGYNALSKQGIKTHRTQAGTTAYYLIATTIAENNRAAIQTIQPQVQEASARRAKESLDEQFVTLFHSANKDNAVSVNTEIEALAGKYKEILRLTTSIPLQRELEASINRCGETGALMICVAHSPVAQEQLKGMQKKMPVLPKKANPNDFPDPMLVIYVSSALFFLAWALLVYLCARKIFQSRGTPIPK